MPQATFSTAIIPSKTVAAVVTLRFPFMPEVGEKIKQLGFWWAPAPTQCWYIPERVRTARAKAVMVTSAARLFAAHGLDLVDEGLIIPTALALLAAGEANSISNPPATMAADGVIHRADVAASHAAALAADRNTTFAPAPRPSISAQIAGRAATHGGQSINARTNTPAPQNLNRVVADRMQSQLSERSRTIAGQAREVPPTPLAERVVYLLQTSVSITNNGQTVVLNVADLERVRDFLTCPLENSFNQDGASPIVSMRFSWVRMKRSFLS